MNKVYQLILLSFYLLSNQGCTGFVSPATGQQVENYPTISFTRKWVRSTRDPQDTSPHGSDLMAPVVDDERIYQGNGNDSLRAFDKSTGLARWVRPIKYGVSGGVFVDSGVVYAGGSDGQFYALEALSGKVLWSFPAKSEITGRPVVAEKTVFFLTANNTLFALDAQSGKQKWLISRPLPTALSVRGASKPIVYENRLYVGFGDGSLVSIRPSDGTLVWERPLSSSGRFRDVDGQPLIFKDLVIASSFEDGTYALRRSDGQIAWKADIGSSSDLVLARDRIFIAGQGETLSALDPNNGRSVWSWKSPHGLPSSPAVFGEHLIIGTSAGAIYSLDITTGKHEGFYSTGKGVAAAPFVDQKTKSIFIFSQDSNLFSLGLSFMNKGHLF